jgi:hypothetical protein
MRLRNWNEYNLNPLTRNNWRASLVPAAAVTPAPIAYIKVAAVKKLVVGSQVRSYWLVLYCTISFRLISCMLPCVRFIVCTGYSARLL